MPAIAPQQAAVVAHNVEFICQVILALSWFGVACKWICKEEFWRLKQCSILGLIAAIIFLVGVLLDHLWLETLEIIMLGGSHVVHNLSELYRSIRLTITIEWQFYGVPAIAWIVAKLQFIWKLPRG